MNCHATFHSGWTLTHSKNSSTSKCSEWLKVGLPALEKLTKIWPVKLQRKCSDNAVPIRKKLFYMQVSLEAQLFLAYDDCQNLEPINKSMLFLCVYAIPILKQRVFFQTDQTNLHNLKKKFLLMNAFCGSTNLPCFPPPEEIGSAPSHAALDWLFDKQMKRAFCLLKMNYSLNEKHWL